MTINSMLFPKHSDSSESPPPARRLTNSCLIVAATGLGKTGILAGMAKHWPRGRIMVISHRFELNQQLIGELETWCDDQVDLEQAMYHSDRGMRHRIVVASVQTLIKRKRNGKRRMDKFNPMDFGLVLVDEAHYAVSKSYREVFSHFAQNPNCALVGVTATIDRLDGVGLSNVFSQVSTNYDINWGINNGWLVPINQSIYKLKCLKLDEIDSSNGDLNRDQLRRQVESDRVFHEMALPFVNELGESQGIFFAESVEFARRMVSFIKAYRMDKTGECPHNFAVSIDGKLSPQDPLRRALVADFRRGDIRVLVNCQVATEGFNVPAVSLIGIGKLTKSRMRYCLSADTEILTDRGWLGKDDSRWSDSSTKAAGFDLATNAIVWTNVLGRFERALEEGERMYSLESYQTSVRVTERHRMLYRSRRKRGDGLFTVIEAAELACRASEYEIPVSAIQNAEGLPLSDADIEFIGWILTDGTINRKTKQAIIRQAAHQPWIDKLEDTIRRCGFRYTRREFVRKTQFKDVAPTVEFTISFGNPVAKGAGLTGWSRLEPYLDKSLSEAIENISADQFAVLLEAMHLGDGKKQNNQYWTRRSYHISTGNKTFADRLQSLCVRRGYRCSLAVHGYNTAPLYELHIKKTTVRHVGGAAYFDRPVFADCDTVPGETVWCITTGTGTIVTRRNGKVTIMGQTQMVGRGSRPLPGVVDAIADPELRRIAIANSEKPYCKILDYIGQSRRHELFCSLDLMYGSEPAPVLRRAKKILATDKFKGTTQEAIEKARKDVQARQKRDEERQITVGQEYELIDKDDDAGTYRLSDIEQPYCEWYLKKKQPTVGQQKMLKALGFSASQIREMNPRYASKAIEYAIKQAKTPFAKKLRREKMEQMGSTLSQAVDMLGAIKSAKTMDDLKLFGRVIAEDKAKGFEYVTEHRDKLAAAYKAKQQELGQ